MNFTVMAALVTLAANGQLSVNENLTDVQCKEASCVALYGMSCEENEKSYTDAQAAYKKEQAELDQKQEKWELNNPQNQKICTIKDKDGDNLRDDFSFSYKFPCGPKYSHSTYVGLGSFSVTSINVAQTHQIIEAKCVK